MEKERSGAVWLASYPKSGNTWLRLLLEGYRRNGLVDLNDVRIGTSDGGATIMQGVSPMPITSLGWQFELLLRPAALLHLFCRLAAPVYIKTHFANLQPDGGLPHCIPAQFTKQAVYVVRDPRSLVSSVMKFFQFTVEKTVDAMRSVDFRIGGTEHFSTVLVSSWSNHVRSWVGETNFPVHIVKYEDLLEDAEKELREVLVFLGDEEPDSGRIAKAVEATKIAKLQEQENQNGFRENSSTGGGFFASGGGTRWQEELGPRWIKQIEEDHGEVMRALGYLEKRDAVELHTV